MLRVEASFPGYLNIVNGNFSASYEKSKPRNEIVFKLMQSQCGRNITGTGSRSP